MMVKQAWGAGNTALDLAGWAPGPTGMIANTGLAVRDLARGNWGSGIMDAINVPLSAFGGNDIAKGIEFAGSKLLSHFPKSLALRGARAISKPIIGAGRGMANWMRTKPVLNRFPEAFGAFKQEPVNWGATNSFFKGPNSVMKNTWKSTISPEFQGGHGVTKPLIRQAVEYPVTQMGNTQNMRAQAGQNAEQHWGELNQFANAMGSYGARPPGELGPHNAALTASMGY